MTVQEAAWLRACVLLLATLWGCPTSSAVTPQLGVAPGEVQQLSDAGQRVIGGGDASPLQFPWQAGILTPTNQFFCGGSIIDRLWILTAGHCVDPFQEFQVVVGALRMPKGFESHRQTFITKERYLHPRYDMVFLDNDIGLLKLPSKIKYSFVVKPIALPTYSMASKNFVGQTVSISGWGRTSDDTQGSSVLKYTHLKIIANSECEVVYGNTMIGNKLCVSATDGKSVCQGDSGGALVWKRKEGGSTEDLVQIGLTSFVSIEGCTVKMPQGFTKVASFLEYIEQTTGIKIED